MSDFSLWFSTGIWHILDWNGYDHICYIVCLTIPFSLVEWKKILLLVTAFTIGHSITLGLSTIGIISPPQKLIECLIPLTILVTAAYTLYSGEQTNLSMQWMYGSALFFGFIHGMGFSYLLRSLLGKQDSILLPLFSFNLGLEVGQFAIVLAVLIISVFLTLFGIPKKKYRIFLSLVIFGIAIKLLWERI